MNVLDTFEQMRMATALAMYIARESHGTKDVAERVKRSLIDRLSHVDGASYLIMGERGGAGEHRIIGIWREGLLQQTDIGPLQAPVCMALVDALDNKVCYVLGEPTTGRMWSRSSLRQRELRRGVVVYIEDNDNILSVSIRPDCEVVVVRGMPMTPVEFAATRAAEREAVTRKGQLQ